jgi:hypothetical protein
MLYKITVIKTKNNNYEKAEVGMNVEISSNALRPSFGNYIEPFNIQFNDDFRTIGDAFMKKYGVDLIKEGVLCYPSDRYLKCEKIG